MRTSNRPVAVETLNQLTTLKGVTFKSMAGTKITVLVRNDTLEFIPEEHPQATGWYYAFLFVVLVLGLCLNSCVVLCIVLTSLRSTCFNSLLACFSFVTGFENLTNVVASAVFTSSWDELLRIHTESTVRLFCALNATSLQFTSVCQGYILAVLSYETLSTFRSSRNKGGAMKLWVFIAVAGSLGAGLPTGLLFTSYVKQRSGCTPTRLTSQPHYVIATITIIFGCCLPPFFILIIWKYIAQEIFKERRKIHISGSEGNTSGSRSEEHKTPTSLHALYGLLVLFYFTSVLPGLVNVQTTQFYSNYTSQESDLLFGRFEEGTPDDLKPCQGTLFDAVCVLTRYSFTVLSPVLIIFLHKDVKEECRKVFQPGKPTVKEIDFKKQRRNEPGVLVDWKVPVLYLTSAGLYLRTSVLGSPSENENFKYRVQFCDVVLEGSPIKRKQEEASSQANISAKRRFSEAKPPRYRELGQNKFLMNLPSASKASLLSRRKGKRFCPNPIQEEESQLDKSSTSMLLSLDQRMRKRDH